MRKLIKTVIAKFERLVIVIEGERKMGEIVILQMVTRKRSIELLIVMREECSSNENQVTPKCENSAASTQYSVIFVCKKKKRKKNLSERSPEEKGTCNKINAVLLIKIISHLKCTPLIKASTDEIGMSGKIP